MRHIAISYSDLTCLAAAKKLAGQLGLDLLDNYTSLESKRYAYLLLVTPTYLGLYDTSQKNQKKLSAFYIDLFSPQMNYRRKNAHIKDELLAKAINIHPKLQPKILDATAGLGRDSYILASLGYEVTMLERSPIIHALLRDALQRGLSDNNLRATVTKLTLIHIDANEWLKAHPKTYDVIYLDPMFPKRKKTARVKKEMAILQNILDPEEDINALFQMALSCAKNRVVIKRPRISEFINDVKPNYSVMGRHSRFDVYITREKL